MIETECVPYLVDHGLLTARDVVEGAVGLSALPSRKNVFRVTTLRGPSYLVKNYGAGHPAARCEAAVYEALQTSTVRTLGAALPPGPRRCREMSYL